MQMMADVMNMPIRIHKSEQTCAGCSHVCSNSCRIYPKVEDAMEAMGQGFDAEYNPDAKQTSIYAKRYRQYSEPGDFIEQQIASNQHQQKSNCYFSCQNLIMNKYKHIQKRLTSQYAITKTGFGDFYIWKCKCSGSGTRCICHQTKRCSL